MERKKERKNERKKERERERAKFETPPTHSLANEKPQRWLDRQSEVREKKLGKNKLN